MFARAVPRDRRNLVNLGIRGGVFVLSILADGASLCDGFSAPGGRFWRARRHCQRRHEARRPAPWTRRPRRFLV